MPTKPRSQCREVAESARKNIIIKRADFTVGMNQKPILKRRALLLKDLLNNNIKPASG